MLKLVTVHAELNFHKAHPCVSGNDLINHRIFWLYTRYFHILRVIWFVFSHVLYCQRIKHTKTPNVHRYFLRSSPDSDVSAVTSPTDSPANQRHPPRTINMLSRQILASRNLVATSLTRALSTSSTFNMPIKVGAIQRQYVWCKNEECALLMPLHTCSLGTG